MKIKNVLAGVAAAGLAIAPVAASAGTRAASALPTLTSGSMVMGTHSTRAVKKDEQMGGTAIIVAIIAVVAVILGILAATDDDRSDG